MNNTAHTRIASLELARIIAMAAIVGLHCQMALTYWQFDGIPWVGYLINQSARFAVPLFFLISGFLLAPKLNQDPLGTLRRYAPPLLKVWLVWSVIYLLAPLRWQVTLSEGYWVERQGYWNYLLQAPLNSLMEGGLVHLWFIPALLLGVSLIALLIHYQRIQWLLPISAALYLYGLAGGSYLNLTEVPVPFFTRNGPFFSSLIVALGYCIAQYHWRIHSRNAIVMLLIGMLMHMQEAHWLMAQEMPFNGHDFLFGTTLWALGLMLLLLNHPNWGNWRWVFQLTPMILGVYALHLLVIIWLMNLLGAFSIEGIWRDVILYPSALGISLLLVIAIQRTPLKTWLLR